MTTESAEHFKNRKEAHDWLQENGYKISQGKFYQDIKKLGFPVLSGDGSVSKYQVMVYGKNLTTDQAPDPSALDRSEYAHRKEAAEAKISEMKAARMEKEEDALWLHADDAWSALASIVGSLRDAIRRELHDAQVEIVQTAGGDLGRAPEVFENIDVVVNRAFNRVAKKGIDVEWANETAK